jgi:hypothetical protein
MSKRYTRRSELLTEAEKITTQDRNKSYGEPDEDFQRIAAIASAMGFRTLKTIEREDGNTSEFVPLSGSDVARFMIALKLSRLAWMPDHRDSWMDIAGYAGCGYETASLEKERASGEPQQIVTVREGVIRACGPACSLKRHVFAGDCLYRRTGSWLAPAEGER